MNTNMVSRLRQLLYSPSTEYIMEAHNGLSAQIVEQAGFKGIWGSSLTISASRGMRDCNEVSYTSICDVATEICDVVSIPLLMDVDTGYGNFNNARIAAKKLMRSGIAGISIEDKQYPKTNSYAIKAGNFLERADIFCKKISAIRDSVADGIVIVARTEAMIQKSNAIEDALARASLYEKAGADAIFVHSKASDFAEIQQFASRWDGKIPIVISPTTYVDTPTEEYERNGIGMVIWANQMLRSSIMAMKGVAKSIQQKSISSHSQLPMCSVDDVFKYQNMDELYQAEKKYL